MILFSLQVVKTHLRLKYYTRPIKTSEEKAFPWFYTHQHKTKHIHGQSQSSTICATDFIRISAENGKIIGYNCNYYYGFGSHVGFWSQCGWGISISKGYRTFWLVVVVSWCFTLFQLRMHQRSSKMYKLHFFKILNLNLNCRSLSSVRTDFTLTAMQHKSGAIRNLMQSDCFRSRLILPLSLSCIVELISLIAVMQFCRNNKS